jgi:ABC-type antimicrobial peptide transport system permease subunit
MLESSVGCFVVRQPVFSQFKFAATMFTFGVICIETWQTEMPVWSFVLSLLLSFIFFIPIGMIQAMTNTQIGLNVISELMVGYMLPGKPLTMMLFKVWISSSL